MKRNSKLVSGTTLLAIAIWLGASGCSKSAPPPEAASAVAEAPTASADTSAMVGDTSRTTTVTRTTASTPRAANTIAATPKPKTPPKTTDAVPAVASARAPVPAPAPVPTVTPPPAKPTETAGGLDAGPRAADAPVDAALASKGKSLFNQRTCNTCHKMDARLIGPALGPVPRQRSAAWILAMITRPAEMTRSDPIAKQLFQDYKIQMVLPKAVGADEAKALLEYMKNAGK